jgi:hypothetical protein
LKPTRVKELPPMKRLILYVLSFLLLAVSPWTLEAGGKKNTYGSRPYAGRQYAGSRKAPGVARDTKGRIKRSTSEKKKFLKSLGYKRVPSGYEVDHITPLYKGGADKAYNMRLIPKAEHKAKHHKR